MGRGKGKGYKEKRGWGQEKERTKGSGQAVLLVLKIFARNNILIDYRVNFSSKSVKICRNEATL